MKNEKDIFPMWKYHKEKEAKIFYNKDEFLKAGDGWVDSPSKINKEPEDKYLSLEDLTVPELKNILIEDYKQDLDKVKKLKKLMLINLINELKEQSR